MRRPTLPAALLAAVIGSCALALPAGAASDGGGRAAALATAIEAARGPTVGPLAVAVDIKHPGARFPQRFVGLSFEAGSVHFMAAWAHRGDFIQLLRTLGPGVMRIGGNTVDRGTVWVPQGGHKPRNALYSITPADLNALGDIARASGWKIVLGVSLGRYDPQAAKDEISVAKSAIGDNLQGIAIGNEPDLYSHRGLRKHSYGYPQYKREIDAYRSAIASVAAGIPFYGPDLGFATHLAWEQSFGLQEHPTALAMHYYPLTHCGGHPLVSDLLAYKTHRREQAVLHRLISTARTTRLQLRMGETNSVSCSGEPGVSNTYASALWAVDYMSRMLAEGITGVNFHTLPGFCLGYSTVCGTPASAFYAGRLRAQPEYYALLLMSQLAGARQTPISTSEPMPGILIRPWLAPDGHLQLVVVNSSNKNVKLRVTVGAGYRKGGVLALKGRKPSATRNVELGNRRVDGAGRWNPHGLPKVRVRSGQLRVTVGRTTAELITLTP